MTSVAHFFCNKRRLTSYLQQAQFARDEYVCNTPHINMLVPAGPSTNPLYADAFEPVIAADGLYKRDVFSTF